MNAERVTGHTLRDCRAPRRVRDSALDDSLVQMMPASRAAAIIEVWSRRWKDPLPLPGALRPGKLARECTREFDGPGTVEKERHQPRGAAHLPPGRAALPHASARSAAARASWRARLRSARGAARGTHHGTGTTARRALDSAWRRSRAPERRGA